MDVCRSQIPSWLKVGLSNSTVGRTNKLPFVAISAGFNAVHAVGTFYGTMGCVIGGHVFVHVPLYMYIPMTEFYPVHSSLRTRNEAEYGVPGKLQGALLTPVRRKYYEYQNMTDIAEMPPW